MEIENVIKELDSQVKEFISKSNVEAEEQTKFGKKTSEAMKALEEKAGELNERLFELEQKSAAPGASQEPMLSNGEMFVKSDGFAAMQSGKTNKAQLEVKNTIVGADATVAPDRQSGVISGAERALRVADVLPTGVTSSNAVEYTKENVFTNSAAETAEAGAKPESALTFTLESAPVRTIAHWIKLSKQVMDDAPMLASYVDTRMRYGGLYRFDSQLINGNGTAPNISGLLDSGNYTVFSSVANDSAVVSLRKAITQVELADYAPNAVILNPADVQAIDLAEGSDGHFIASDARISNGPSIWGIPIVKSNAVASNSFVLGAFDMACQIWMRQGMTVDLSESDDTNFTTNLVTLRAEMRAALAIYRPASIVGGTLTS